jgi:L-alanine-DL-glutamate epimerase-like enolase superfamily enzyme
LTRARVVPLPLRHPFGISRGTATVIPTVLLELADGALGEGAPVRYLKHRAEDVAAAAEAAAALLPDRPDPLQASRILEATRAATGALAPAQMAVDLALHDRMAKQAGEPLWRFLGLPEPSGRTTTFTIALDGHAAMLRKVAEARGFPALKIKLGRSPESDAAILRAIREAAPAVELLVDANAGWTVGTAPALLALAAELRVALVEQPLPVGALEDTARLAMDSPVPVFLDEDVHHAPDVARVAGCCHGVNVKLAKCGGIGGALAAIAQARACGLGVLLGCMVESSLGIAAASHLAGLADWLDLDGRLLIAEDPAEADRPADAAPWDVCVSAAPGLGVRLR